MVIPICRFRDLKSVYAPPLCICYTCPWLKSRCTPESPVSRRGGRRKRIERVSIPPTCFEAGNHALLGTFQATTANGYGLDIQFNCAMVINRRSIRLVSSWIASDSRNCPYRHNDTYETNRIKTDGEKANQGPSGREARGIGRYGIYIIYIYRVRDSIRVLLS